MDIQTVRTIAAPILKRYQVRRAALFGSIAHNAGTAKSDVDLLLELPPEASLFDFIALKYDLEDALHVSVDLVEYDAVKPSLERYILKDNIPIYTA